MKYCLLGNTGIKVSRICFGALTIGPLQARLSLEEGAEVIQHALEKGINFIDTAELYETYPYIKEALKKTQKNVIISSKSYAYTKKLMQNSLEKARKELERDVIDIFLLHEQESILTVRGHWEAVEFLLKAKAEGKVKAIGLSTHTLKGIEAAIEVPEIEVIHAIVNYKGLGILDGDINKMLELLSIAKGMGKGIYGMKPIGGGNLISDAQQALQWAFQRIELDAIAVGMQSKDEVDINIDLLMDKIPDAEKLLKLRKKKRILHIEDYCVGCGECAKKCTQNALQIINNKAEVDEKKCVLCGYCGAVCPEFAIKII